MKNIWTISNHMLQVQVKNTQSRVLTLPVALINMKKVPNEYLSDLLEELIREEEYEKAAQCRDEINFRS